MAIAYRRWLVSAPAANEPTATGPQPMASTCALLQRMNSNITVVIVSPRLGAVDPRFESRCVGSPWTAAPEVPRFQS
ncbi:MAG: hypothetical protein H6905_10080 [Hyphomicrobiales bacterium]|nr:hypothetical protein [Hyphomicrobiales bacterium]